MNSIGAAVVPASSTVSLNRTAGVLFVKKDCTILRYGVKLAL